VETLKGKRKLELRYQLPPRKIFGSKTCIRNRTQNWLVKNANYCL